ncbi:hypothetical protein [Deinococcus cellulosilyticus]|uniref:Uncharacterized protein n=1 Tax=Deinococcus cellulosilyticus (strain DSM 18568 / NBRC 106333 / KACC 11606 / 5516J-15) TaxID=1223518 RepID=A0A511MW57_DEIC1|nr:hypothetical protein [Deinococcus cellulosilyticus]GEM44814.1 hypothetical protein DC3_04490 [Deinococcus cellulosilyticus NBRC 106333 = KACC 11606]
MTLEDLQEDLSALKVTMMSSVSTLDERTQQMQKTLEMVAQRPQPGVPMWVILVMAVPSTLLALGVLILALVQVFSGLK